MVSDSDSLVGTSAGTATSEAGSEAVESSGVSLDLLLLGTRCESHTSTLAVPTGVECWFFDVSTLERSCLVFSVFALVVVMVVFVGCFAVASTLGLCTFLVGTARSTTETEERGLSESCLDCAGVARIIGDPADLDFFLAGTTMAFSTTDVSDGAGVEYGFIGDLSLSGFERNNPENVITCSCSCLDSGKTG